MSSLANQSYQYNEDVTIQRDLAPPNSMDLEMLINLVYQRPPLWDIKDQFYRLKDIQLCLWMDIAKEVGESVEVVMQKWKALKHAFLIEHRRRRMDNVAPAVSSTCPFYNTLMFLSDSIAPPERKVLPQEYEEVNNSRYNNECVIEFNNSGNIISREIQVFDSSTTYDEYGSINKQQGEGKNTYEKTSNEEVSEIESRVIGEREKLSEDGDYQFLMSIYPFLKSIPMDKKLFVREKLQKVLFEQQYLRKMPKLERLFDDDIDVQDLSRANIDKPLPSSSQEFQPTGY